MKTFSIAHLAVLVAAVAGSPHPLPNAAADAAAVAQPVSAPASNIFESKLVKRAKCYHESNCSWFFAAKCEHYCRKWGADVTHMEKCDWLNRKRCCCSK